MLYHSTDKPKTKRPTRRKTEIEVPETTAAASKIVQLPDELLSSEQVAIMSNKQVVHKLLVEGKITPEEAASLLKLFDAHELFIKLSNPKDIKTANASLEKIQNQINRALHPDTPSVTLSAVGADNHLVEIKENMAVLENKLRSLAEHPFPYPTGKKAEEYSKLFWGEKQTKTLSKSSNEAKRISDSLKLNSAKHSEIEHKIVIRDNAKHILEAYYPRHFHFIMSNEDLTRYIPKAWRDEGLRHFYAILIILGENFNKTEVIWDLDRHLELLGYKREADGSFKTKHRIAASNIVKIFTQFYPTLIEKSSNGNNEVTRYECLFSTAGFEVTKLKDQNVITKITLISREWYRESFTRTKEKSLQYINILQKIVKINHKDHWITLRLYPYIAKQWRVNLEPAELKVKTIMEFLELKMNGKHKFDNLRLLEAELDYMCDNEFIGKWENKGKQHKEPSACSASYECTLVFYPPQWQNKELSDIKLKKFMPAKRSLTITNRMLSREEFTEIFYGTGYTLSAFARTIGCSRTLVRNIINEKARISKVISDKVKLYYLSTGITQIPKPK